MYMAAVSLPYGGGLGNLLFYHHAAFAVSKKLGVPMYINSDYQDEKRKNIALYDKIFSHVEFVNRESLILQNKGVMYTEPNYYYDPINVPADTVVFMQGYFQSYKYFWDYMGDIIKQFQTNLGCEFMKKEYDELRSGEKTVCVHVRRTDYLSLSDIHTNLKEEYYENALTHVAPGRLLVFSDDIGSIKHWDVWKTRDTVFVDEPDPVRTLWLMSLCDAFVIANSSLSLNAYLMAKYLRDAPGVAPVKWFEPKGVQFRIDDIVPPGTITL
jgi:hypothetical protein